MAAGDRTLKLTIIGDADSLAKEFKKAQKQGRAFGKGAEKLGKSLTKGVTLPLLAVGAASIKAAIDFESSFTGIKKTVIGTTQQFEELAEGMRDLSKEIPVNVNELNKIGEMAGQLGVRTKDILKFTKTIAMLGVTTNLSTEEAATGLARFSNIMGTATEDVGLLGSSIVALGNSMATTEQEILNMSLRIGAAGKSAGFSEDQIFAFAGAISSVGIEAAAGGTALSRIINDISTFVALGGSELEKIAEVSEKTSAEFVEAWEKDAAGALQEFTGGLGDMGKEGQSILPTLKDIGFEEIRVAAVTRGLAEANRQLADGLDTASKAIQNEDALLREAELRFGTAESKMKILSNTVQDVGIDIGGALVPAMLDLIEAGQPVIKMVGDGAEAFAEMDPAAQKTAVALIALVAAAGPVIFVGAKLVQGYTALTAAFAVNTVATKINTISLAKSKVAGSSMVGQNLLTASSYHRLTAAVNTTTTATTLETAATKASILAKRKAILAFGALSAVAVVAVDDMANLAVTMEDENERTKRILETHGFLPSVFDSWGRSLLGADRRLFGLSVGLEKYDGLSKDSKDSTLDWRGAIARVTSVLRSNASMIDDSSDGMSGLAEIMNSDTTPAVTALREAIDDLSGAVTPFLSDEEKLAKINRDVARTIDDVTLAQIAERKALEEMKKTKDDSKATDDEKKESEIAYWNAIKNTKDAVNDEKVATSERNELVGAVEKRAEAEAKAIAFVKEEYGLTQAKVDALIKRTENWNNLEIDAKFVKLKVEGQGALDRMNLALALFAQQSGGQFGPVKPLQPVTDIEFANGGRPPVGQVAIVGERGKELFVPDTAGRIIPADQTARLLAARSSNSNPLGTAAAALIGAAVTMRSAANKMGASSGAIVNTFRNSINEEERRIEELWQREMALWREQDLRLAEKAEQGRKDDAAALVKSLKDQFASKAGLNPFIFGPDAQNAAIQRDIDKAGRDVTLAARELNDAQFALRQGLSTRTDDKGKRQKFTDRERQDARFRVADAEDALADTRQAVTTLRRERDWLLKTLKENKVPGFTSGAVIKANKVVPIKATPAPVNTLASTSSQTSGNPAQVNNFDFRGAVFSGGDTMAKVKEAAREAVNELSHNAALMGRS